MWEKDKFYRFLHNLSSWATQQVKLTEPTDLTSTFRLVEKLVDVEIVHPRINGANARKLGENANKRWPKYI